MLSLPFDHLVGNPRSGPETEAGARHPDSFPNDRETWRVSVTLGWDVRLRLWSMDAEPVEARAARILAGLVDDETMRGSRPGLSANGKLEGEEGEGVGEGWRTRAGRSGSVLTVGWALAMVQGRGNAQYLSPRSASSSGSMVRGAEERVMRRRHDTRPKSRKTTTPALSRGRVAEGGV